MALNRTKLLETADKLVRQGKIDEAIRQYLALSEDNPRDVNTINRIGDLYVRLRKNKEAIRQFIRIADFYAGDGFHLKAIAMYKKITKLDPSHLEANERLADLYAKQGLVSEARTQYLSLAEQCLKAGTKPKAIDLYRKIQELEPDNLKVRVILADLAGKEGDPTAAVDGLLSAASDLLGRGMGEEALKVLLKALRLQPARPELHARIPEVLRNLGKKPREITTTLEHLHQASPDSNAFLEILAENYLLVGRSGDFDKLKGAAKSGERRAGLVRAEARFRHARGESEAAVALLVSSLQEILAGAGPGEGAALLEEALRIRPDDADLLERLLELRTTASDRKGMASAGERLARLLCKQEEWDRAAQVLDRLRDLSPENPALEDLLSQVDDHRKASLPVSSPAAPSEAAPAEVPSLDELEKVVELDTDLDEETVESAFEEPVQEAVGDAGGEISAGIEEGPAPETEEAASSDSEDPLLPEVEEEDSVESGGSLSPDGAEVPSEELEAVALEEPEEEGSGDAWGMEASDEERPLDEEGEEQDSAYAGKSVIQEMREEPKKADVDEDFLTEHFTEAEVFLKYGLAEKAREQLQTILGRYPDHIPSLKKMREIHAEEGKKAEAAEVLRKIVEIHRSRGEEEQAREMEEQARELDSTAGPGEAPEPSVPAGRTGAPAEKADTLVSLDSELELDLDLPDLPLQAPRESPSPSSPAKRAAKSPVPSAPPVEEPEEDFTIELVAEEGEERPAEERAAFDPEKASRFDFYLQQRLLEEAEEILLSMERAAPGHPAVVERRSRLAESRPASPEVEAGAPEGDLDMDVERAFGNRPPTAPPAPPAPEAAGEEGFFDLAAELKAHVVEASDDPGRTAPPPGISSGEEASIDEIFKAFRKKVDQQVEEEDYETRYNLGIAYKEMGLLDEAIGEFQYASRDPRLFLECCSILGICFREKGMTDLAIKWYRKALESTGHSEDKYQGLRYDLGDLYMEKGDYSQALGFFSEVYGVNSNYRDVASRIRELKKRVG